MGCRGLSGFLYKGWYFIGQIQMGAYPDEFGAYFASLIPRKAAARQAWIEATIKKIEKEVVWRYEHNVPNEISEFDEDNDDRFHFSQDGSCGYDIIVDGNWDRPLNFQDIIKNKHGDLPIGMYDVNYTYIIDFDNRAFTINDLVHFNLDNMPPGDIDRHFHTDTMLHHSTTPIEHIATVARWRPPTFDLSQVQHRYTSLGIRILELKEWGVPEWTGLTVAQELSAELAQIIMLDNAQTMSNPDLRSRRTMFRNCCWSILCAAAPNSLMCPSVPPPEGASDSLIWCIPDGAKDNTSAKLWAHPHYVNPKKCRSANEVPHNDRYYWFRGCLVVFCSRLDSPKYVQHETLGLIDRLRAGGRTTGLGLAFSGRHVLSVAIHGNDVRRSRPLPFHDAKMKLLDGFLLVTHLLAPLLRANKSPWRQSTELEPAISMPKLPTELLQQIVFKLDDHSYHQLPHVSRLFRKLHANYPRVLGCHLLSCTGNGNYQVFSSANGTTDTLHLQKKEGYQQQSNSLVGTFQYLNHGPHNLKPHPERLDRGLVRGLNSEREVVLRYRPHDSNEGTWPALQMQVVHGIWEFIEPKDGKSNSPKSPSFKSESNGESTPGSAND